MSPRAESIAIKGEQTRKTVLEAAIQLFGDHGYDGCSLGQIAKQAGVVQSALHYHFGTKDKLLAEALESHYPRSATRPDLEAIERGETTFSEEIVRGQPGQHPQPAHARPRRVPGRPPQPGGSGARPLSYVSRRG